MVKLDIIYRFQEVTSEVIGERSVLLTGKWFKPSPPEPPVQLDVFAYASGVHPLPECNSPKGLELVIPVRRRRKVVLGFDANRKNPVRHFGNRQRRALLRTGAVMSKQLPERGQTYEVTLTIPGSTQAAFRCVAAHTSWLMNRLMQVVRDCERKAQVEVSWFYVWEWQKRGALHLHMALGAADGCVAKQVAETLEMKWFDLLLELRDHTGIDVFARGDGTTWRDTPSVWQSHVARIEKSLAAYFAKYASKDKDTKEAARNGSAPKYYPRTWWGRSRNLAEAEREQTIVIRLDYLSENDMCEWYSRLDSIFSSYKSLKKYSYDFEVSRPVSWEKRGLFEDCVVDEKKRTATRLCAYGERLVSYFDDDVFSQIYSEVTDTLAPWMVLESVRLGAEWSGQLPTALAGTVRAMLEA